MWIFFHWPIFECVSFLFPQTLYWYWFDLLMKVLISLRDNCWPCVCYIFDYVRPEGKSSKLVVKPCFLNLYCFWHNCNYFFQFSDCSESDVVGDGVCDDSANIMECSYDGGDCCFGLPFYCDDCLCQLPSPVYRKSRFLE